MSNLLVKYAPYCNAPLRAFLRSIDRVAQHGIEISAFIPWVSKSRGGDLRISPDIGRALRQDVADDKARTAIGLRELDLLAHGRVIELGSAVD